MREEALEQLIALEQSLFDLTSEFTDRRHTVGLGRIHLHRAKLDLANSW
jgi:hypothetical protein